MTFPSGASFRWPGSGGARTDGAWIVDTAGPESAAVYEVMTNDTRQRTGSGVIAAANHFADPAWGLPPPPEHSGRRYTNLLRLAKEAKGSIDAGRMMEIRTVRFEDGGATFHHSKLGGGLFSTDHQVVFLPASRTVFVKVFDRDWQKVEPAPLFGD